MDFEGFLNALLELLSTIGLKIIYAAIVLFAGLKLIKWLRRKLPVFPILERLDAGLRSFLCSTLAVVLYALLFISVAMILGIPTTSFIAALASCLAAIGLAMQGSLSNFAGGLMLLIFQPFRAGDYISAPEQGVEGTVKEITVIYTVLRTYDNIEVTIPNGTLTNSVVKNISAADPRRLDLSFRVDPATPLKQVEAVIGDVLALHAEVLADPAPSVVLTDVTDSAMIWGVRVWCPGSQYWPVRFALMQGVKAALDEHGIVTPRQQVDVHIAPGSQTPPEAKP